MFYLGSVQEHNNSDILYIFKWLKYFIYEYVCMPVWIYMHHMYVSVEDRKCQIHWNLRQVGCESPSMGAGNLDSL